MPGWDVPHRHLLFEWIDIDVINRGPDLWFVYNGDPGDIAIEDQNQIGLLERLILTGLIPLISNIQGIVGRVIYVRRDRFEYSYREPVTQLNKLFKSDRASAKVRCDDEWFAGRG